MYGALTKPIDVTVNKGDVYELAAIVKTISGNDSVHSTNTYIHLNSLSFSQNLHEGLNGTLSSDTSSCHLHVTLLRIYFDDKTVNSLTSLGTNESVCSHNASQKNITKLNVWYTQEDSEETIIYNSTVACIHINITDNIITNTDTSTTVTSNVQCQFTNTATSNVQFQFTSYSSLTTFYFVLLQYFVLKLMLN